MGAGKCGRLERSGKGKSCDASNVASQKRRAVIRRAREPNGFRFIKLGRKEMRNWCAALAMCALLALPLGAQQKNSRTGDETRNAAAHAEKDADANSAVGSSKPVTPDGIFALPA